jgi:hypothetical protein
MSSLPEAQKKTPRQVSRRGVFVGCRADAYTVTVSATSLNSLIWSKFM